MTPSSKQYERLVCLLTRQGEHNFQVLSNRRGLEGFIAFLAVAWYLPSAHVSKASELRACVYRPSP